jgi:ethanolamine ammonia-lyase large subunit
MREVRARGVFLAEGHGAAPHDLRPDMAAAIGTIVRDAKQAFWATLSDDYVARIPGATPLATRAQSRAEYILRPELGEQLSDEARRRVQSLAAPHASYTAQLVISDGLNPLAIGNPDQLLPFLEDIRARLGESGWQVAPGHLVVRGGRVRAGYEIGSLLFGGRSGRYALIHVVGERPGTGHHTMSAYISVADGAAWGTSRGVDHDTTRVVSGVSLTALAPRDGAAAVARVIGARG